MKLLVVSHSCATPINQALYSQLERETGWEISIVVPALWRDEFGRALKAECLYGFKGEILPVPVIGSGRIIFHAYRVAFGALLRKVNPDVVYVNHEPYAVATAQVYSANRSTLNRPIGFYSCQNIEKRYPLPIHWTEQFVYRNSQFAFPISRNVEQVLRDKGLSAPTSIVPLGVDTNRYQYDCGAAQAARLRYGGPEQILFGYVGRFVEAKGLKTLIDAASKLKDLRWRLLLVGAGPMEAELRRFAETSGISDRIEWVGFVPHPEIPALLSALNALILPSETRKNWKEQFGRVVLEAMACGVPVIGSNSGEIPELISDTGGGFVFPEGDASMLAELMRKIAMSPERAAEVGRRGMGSVADRYSLTSAARTVEQMIRSVHQSRLSQTGGRG